MPIRMRTGTSAIGTELGSVTDGSWGYDGDGDYGEIIGLLFRIRWCYDVARRIGVCQGCPISPRRGPYLARNATIFIIVALEIIIATINVMQFSL